MGYEARPASHGTWAIYRDGKWMLYTGTEDDARRIAALLNADDELTPETVAALGDGALGRAVREREGLRAALEGLLARAHTLALRLGDAGLYGLPEDMAGGANPQAFQAASSALDGD